MRRALSSLAVVTLLGIAGALLMGHLLTAPVPRAIGNAPADLHAKEVEFGGVHGWFVPAGASAPCVLLMHGVRGDRRSMIGRARMLRAHGYAALLFDFQAHGASIGRRITFGHVESQNAHAAIDVLRTRFACRHIAAIGQSLGGAAALLGERPINVDALILESVYPGIEAAIENRLRMRIGAPGTLLAPLLTLQLQPLLGIDSEALQPKQRLGAFQAPLLIISGSEDRHTTLAETQGMYAAAKQPKQSWVVTSAGHVDLQRFAPQEYERRVLGFLAAHLPMPNRG